MKIESKESGLLYMCGIAGIHTGSREVPDKQVLLSMAGELLHRGPDGVGLYTDAGCGLTNTRLSIVDLAGGDQPISNEVGECWVVQNGEIYNHLELRAQLESLGHHFSTDCDTEVIAHAYEEWGERCLERFNGPFALAIWDRRDRSLFIARDRYGVRPLFLGRYGKHLVFASEAKAIFRHPDAVRELDPLGLIDTFSLWAPLPDRSAFKGIRELPPGHWLKVRADGTSEERRWWDLPFQPSDARRTQNEGALAEELGALLEDSVRLRLRADVPVAVYVSGGLDSSVIAALAHHVGGARLQGFAVGFSDARFDESEHQDRIADKLGIDLHRVRVGPSDIANLFPDVIRLAEKPILRTAPAPMLALSALVRRHGMKCVLTGEGADEIFAGYDLFRESQIRRFWARQPQSISRPRLFDRIYPWLTRRATGSPAFARQFFGQGFEDAGDPFYSHRIRWGTTSRLLRFLDPALVSGIHFDEAPATRLAASLHPDFERFTGLGKAQHLEIVTFLHGYLLHSQGDRMMMGHAVEGRFPFLDPRVGEFAASLPDSMRLRGLQDKYLLRKAADRLLPPEIAGRPKRPYRAPILSAFVGPNAPDYVEHLMSPRRIVETGVFASKTVGQLWDKCVRNAPNGVSEMDEMAFVGVLSTQLLHEHLIRRPTLAPSPKPTRAAHGDHVVQPAALAGVS
ncbi:MAG: asparagine synthase (glutamine-hydrolyzing) [Gemmataceae bacterium]